MGACFCTGRCRQPPYSCSAGDFANIYDPDYEKKIGERAVLDYILKTKKGKTNE